jgi:23S rRNA (adenine2503-C2)-methyltransferase
MEHIAYFLDFDLHDWEKWAVENGFPKFRAQQIHDWIFKKFAVSLDEFTNIPKDLKDLLAQSFEFYLPEIDTALKSIDQSVKFLLKTPDHFFIESVLMPLESRVTLCISSQVGCKMACTFCQTGKMGLARNLSSGEILSQILLANRYLQQNGSTQKVSNIVFMGMGEPLDNFDAVVKAVKSMTHENALGLSKNRVTISTCGLVPEIEKLGQEVEVSLAISLHSADDNQRSNMMPINKKYSLQELKKALLAYPVTTRHGITFEYVMIHDENDSIDHAKKLVKFIHGLKAKVNLIPMNPHPGSSMKATDPVRLKAFQTYLSDRSIPAPIRYSRGQDVSAACGQLVAKRKEELAMLPKDVARLRRIERRSASCSTG